MKSTNCILYISLVLFITTISCNKQDEINAPGSVAIIFEHKVGEEDLILRTPGDQTYDFTDTKDQQFNISKFGFYVSEIKFFSPDGAGYADPKKITADDSKITGFYHVLESDLTSQEINITNVPARTYDKIEFTIGVKSYTVIEGTPGGILDPEKGAWFVNMEAGYVNLAIEGTAVNSGQEYIPESDEPEILEKTFSIHLSGWKDVAADPGQEPIFVDNTKTIELNLNEPITVENGLVPEVHVNVNLGKILEGIDFSQTFTVEGPSQSRAFSDKFIEAFTLDFVTQ
ncbi:MAG: MbnP family protein [Bacteroidota bacterium]